MTESARQKLIARIAKKCARLYDPKTPSATRRDLSLEVSFLRAKLGAPSVDAMLASDA